MPRALASRHDNPAGSIALVHSGATIDTFAGNAAIHGHGERLRQSARVSGETPHNCGSCNKLINMFSAIVAQYGIVRRPRVSESRRCTPTGGRAEPLSRRSQPSMPSARQSRIFQPRPMIARRSRLLDGCAARVRCSAIYTRGSVVEGTTLDAPTVRFVARWRGGKLVGRGLRRRWRARVARCRRGRRPR